MDTSTLLSAFALLVSLISLLLVRKNWREPNRPIVTAFLNDDTRGGTALFNLIVLNTGNRPTADVHLHAEHAQIASLLDPEADAKLIASIAFNFRPESTIPLLRNGEQLTTSFGSFSTDPQNPKWLRYGASANINITYSDLDRRRYKSKLKLKVYERHGFGGGTWVEHEPACKDR